ncbi:phage tail protein [Paenibacillus sp. sgz500958]|uniref:phage tail protein n=1 Tax=Paenibacillus sp. sgz500958 TaxID=3242475 RepID=UPI0036D38329
MRKSYITVYDLQMRRVAELENALTVGYSTPFNGLWTASFTLPADDEKNAECRPLYFVELYDGDERLELFRILPNTTMRDSGGGTITYQCEHVLATLLDDVLFQYHTVGNLGVYTADVLTYILQRQAVQRWVIDNVQFDRQFEYNWENENLLGAILSVPKPFAEEYQWKYDTSVCPWKLSLVQPSQQEEAYIRYGVNMQGITRVEDPSDTVTRIYGLGYGEGVNQLTFAELNGGLPYVQAEPEYIERYGLISSVFVDSRIEYPDVLLGHCQALLREAKEPRVSYTVQASELYAITNDPIDRFKSGAMVRVIDQEMGIDVITRVLNVSKQDVFGQPGNVTLEIANRTQDISGTIATLRNRQYASEVYAQGATNLDTRDFADNCDPDHPAILKFYVPEETVRINKVRLSFETESFRAYSKAIESAPATSSGPSSTQTTSTEPARIPTTSVDESKVLSSTTSDEWMQFAIEIPDAVSAADDHNHGIPNGTTLMVQGGGTVTFIASGGHVHALTSDHRHLITIPGHFHNVQIPAHNHEMPHTHQIPAHSHEIEYGIYEGPSPNTLIIKVDGHTIPNNAISGTDVDIIPYLSKDDSGRVQRGTWHTIQITPDSLGRVVANVVTQLFVQSRGGGNY